MKHYTITCLAVWLIAASSSVLADPAPDEVITYKTVGDKELKLHVFNPSTLKDGPPRPAIVFFHGGGWANGSPSQFYDQARHLADRGMVAISAQYRLTKKDKVSPKECLIDAKSAIRWIRQNAKRLNIVAETLAAGGGSAGGHLAAATGNCEGFEEEGEDASISSKPAALVLFNPVYDNGPGGYGHKQVQAYWESFSPMHNLSKSSPPTIVFLGDEDSLVPVSTAEKYRDTMNADGVDSELHVFAGQPHSFFNKGRCSDEVYTSIISKMDAFLEKHGYLKKNAASE
jgi:acetyl esterase/lipase